MNRAGLLNFWYYEDEVFDFADGKLLLRGNNGSGKSVTMQSILPILLDGRKSPDRLDPFGSRARKIEDYLLGEKEIVDRDERTGYLFLEYKRKDTNQYLTTGIGLQARRHKNLHSWGFVITDNRRIGEDFYLYETVRQSGEQARIPLSRIQLENRIGSGGHVVRTTGEYKKLVNKYIFGFEDLDAYDDLIKLLIQLRSPKLSKDFRPTVIYDILEAALPPLTDDDLRHLSDTIEHMDQTKQQIEQLEREYEALDKVIHRYHAYNEYRLVETASQYDQAKKSKAKETKQLKEKVAQEQALTDVISKDEARQQRLEQEEEVLEQKQKRLEKHEVWSLEEERKKELEQLQSVKAEWNRKDQTITDKTKQELQTKERLETVEVEVEKLKEKMQNQLADLSIDGEAASFERHELNVQDFERNQMNDFSFTVWKKEAEKHYEQLDSISEQLRAFDQTKENIKTLENTVATLQMEIDQTGQEQQDWQQIFTRDKQEKINEIHLWVEENPFFQVDDEIIQQSTRMIEQLYEPTAFAEVRDLYTEVKNRYVIGINEQIASKNSILANVKEEKLEQNALLEKWQNTTDPELPNQHEETKAARKELKEKNISFLPFYEAVEFQDHVTEDVRKNLEAAIMDAGIIDALITDQAINLQHDRLIKPNPQMMAYTLADYLMPDVKEESNVSSEQIDDVLRSILIEHDQAEEAIAINTDGTYTIGLIEGHAVPVEDVHFIGRSARKRYREAQIEQISAQIEVLTEEINRLTTEIYNLEEKNQHANVVLAKFPNDDDLKVSFQEITTYDLKLKQLEKQLVEEDQKKSSVVQTLQEIKRKLTAATQGLNIEFTLHAYQEAKYIQRQYEKAVSELEHTHTTYRHQQQNVTYIQERLVEIEEDVMELKGEQNILEDKKTRTEQHINEIENQLEIQGMDEVRAQIQQVQKDIATTKEALNETRINLPKKHVQKETIEKEIKSQEQKLRFLEVLMSAWESVYIVELNQQFVTVPQEIGDSLNAKTKWIVEHYKHRLGESSKLESELSKVYFEQYSNLMEYRMTETVTSRPDINIDTDEWLEEQRIILNEWRNKAQRKVIQLDFQGKRLSPYYVMEKVEEDRARQQTFLNDQDRQLYEDILFDSVGNKLRSRIYRAQEWTKQMNKLMENSDSTSGIKFSIQWKPRTAETEAELDTKELVDLLRRDARLLKEDDLEQVMNHFRSRIDRAKELIELEGAGSSLLQVLKEVLDYRYWFSFVLSYQRVGEPKRELTNNAFYKFSGGEKAMAMYIPLFTACYSRYLEAEADAPYIISLDEAFAGVDDENISSMFRIVEELDFDYIMNSQILWGDYDTVPALSICELIRPKNANYVSVIRYKWDGSTRHLLNDEIKERELQSP